MKLPDAFQVALQVEKGEDYSVIYELSVQLDELIAKYYNDLKNNKKKLAWIAL